MLKLLDSWHRATVLPFYDNPFKAPDYAGNKPAGYIISNTKDMARWLGIQMGIVQDIPEIFHTVIEKSHRGDMSVSAVNGMYYAAGWSVNAEQTIIEHTGAIQISEPK